MTHRFAQVLREQFSPGRAPQGKHQHAEAFCLMWYACRCGHQERIWNSRDGVTPFGTRCPSCNQPTLQHERWSEDAYAPDFKPAFGQRQWVSMTRERAEHLARDSAAAHKAAGGAEVSESQIQRLIESFFHDGNAPDLVVTGYAETPAPTA
jgi:hypothetical protein